MACDAKEREINDYVAGMRDEREKLIARLNELDAGMNTADEDLRRLNRARNALRNPSEEQMMRDDITSLAATGVNASPRPASPKYFPGR